MDRGLLPCALLVASSLLLAFSSGLLFKSLGMLSMGRKHFLCTSTVAYGKAPRLRNVEHVEMIAIPDLHDDFEIEFAVFGVPIPLQRHRVSRGVIFNPSRKVQMFALHLGPYLFIVRNFICIGTTCVFCFL